MWRRRGADASDICMKRIGLLGGSFNPAHRGHRRISLAALEALGLDELWWLVSPGNPLKPTKGMAPYEARLASAREQAKGTRIKVSDFERRAGTRYTVHFGPMKSRTAILEVERPHRVRTRFGNLILKGESDVRFEPTPHGTRLVQVFRTRGIVSAAPGRLGALPSWRSP